MENSVRRKVENCIAYFYGQLKEIAVASRGRGQGLGLSLYFPPACNDLLRFSSSVGIQTSISSRK